MPGPDAGFDQGFDQDPFDETPPTDAGTTIPGGPDAGPDQGFDQNPFGPGPGGGSAGTATTYTLTGPASLVKNQPGTFTVSLPTGQQVLSSVTITPMAGGVGGSFSPATVTLPPNTAGASATFTFTPAATGTLTILVNNDSLLTDPASLVLRVSATASLAPSAYPQIVIGTTGWLHALLTNQLEQINIECAALIAGERTVVVDLGIGEPRSLSRPRLCIIQSGTPTPALIAQHEWSLTCRYRLLFLVPYAGDNTAANFEMAREIVSQNLAMLFMDEGKTLTPTVSAPPIGAITALVAYATQGADIFPYTLADETTKVDGFEQPWQATYSFEFIPD